MAKKRVHEIAKERGITSKEALAALKKAGLEVTNASSSVEEADAAKAFANGASATEAPAKETKAEAKADGDAKAEAAATAEGDGAESPSGQADAAPQGGGQPRRQQKAAPDSKQRPAIQRPPTPEGEVKRAGPEGRGPRILQEAPPPEPPRQQGGQRGGPRQADRSGGPSRAPNGPGGGRDPGGSGGDGGRAPGGPPRGGGARPTRGGRAGEGGGGGGGGRRRRVVIDSQAARRDRTPPPPQQPARRGRGRRRRPQWVEPDLEAQAAAAAEAAAQEDPPVPVRSGSTVKEVAESLQLSAPEVIKKLMELGEMATLTQTLSDEAVEVLAEAFDKKVTFHSATDDVDEAPAYEDTEDELIERPPVITIMGHVDHGKTSLLDAIRETEVAAGEAGGITQHIGAYQVHHDGHTITFLDTPGHEAFTAMRARGAKATDIAVLVVAADDGVMPQTVEAINHARAAAVPIIVAVNKIDKPGSDPDRVKRELANLSLVPEEWGGETIFVHTSAKRGDGVAQLLEMTALQAEVLELRANPSRAARGVIVEGRLDRGRGPVATALIQSGTLKEGDAVVVGSHSGRIRAMFNDRGKKVASAGPSDPVELLGLSGVPQAGDTFLVVADERKARQIATVRTERDKLKGKGVARVTLEDLHKQIAAGEVKELRLILKADVQGSVEALTESLERLSTDEVRLKVIHGSVGTVNESDVMLASASNAIVLGFNVKADVKAAATAQADGVDLRSYNVIYDAINDVKAALSGMLAPEIRETLLGRAQVRQLFPITKVGTIYGSSVTEGKMVRGARVRIKRGETVLGESTIVSLKRFKDDVREVLQGLECGIGVEGIRGVSPNDVIEAFTTEEVARTL